MLFSKDCVGCSLKPIHVNVQHVHTVVHAQMHVFSVNMPEREYLHIQVCVCVLG